MRPKLNKFPSQIHPPYLFDCASDCWQLVDDYSSKQSNMQTIKIIKNHRFFQCFCAFNNFRFKGDSRPRCISQWLLFGSKNHQKSYIKAIKLIINLSYNSLFLFFEHFFSFGSSVSRLWAPLWPQKQGADFEGYPFRCVLVHFSRWRPLGEPIRDNFWGLPQGYIVKTDTKWRFQYRNIKFRRLDWPSPSAIFPLHLELS